MSKVCTSLVLTNKIPLFFASIVLCLNLFMRLAPGIHFDLVIDYLRYHFAADVFLSGTIHAAVTCDG